MPKRTIPDERHIEIYQLYTSGMLIPDIVLLAKNDWNIADASASTVRSVITKLRELKLAHLNELLQSDSEDQLGRMKWLQRQLEEVAIETRSSDKPLFLKVADRLIQIYQLQANLKQFSGKDVLASDNGREQLIAELTGLSETKKTDVN